MMYGQVIGGLIVLLLGGDILVRGAVSLSRRLGISPLVVGLTVVAMGTSMPELVVVLNAAIMDAGLGEAAITGWRNTTMAAIASRADIGLGEVLAGANWGAKGDRHPGFRR